MRGLREHNNRDQTSTLTCSNCARLKRRMSIRCGDLASGRGAARTSSCCPCQLHLGNDLQPVPPKINGRLYGLGHRIIRSNKRRNRSYIEPHPTSIAATSSTVPWSANAVVAEPHGLAKIDVRVIRK